MAARYTRAFFFLVDGARVDIFRELLDRGDLPNVARYLVERGGYRTATTVFPSVTGVAYVPYLTGLFPGRANIPGYRWFDRERYQRRPLSVMRFRNYSGLGSYLMDRDLSKQAQTLFELLKPSSNIFSGISRGTGLRRNHAYFRRVPAALKFFRTGSWDHIDEAGERFLLRAGGRREKFTFHTTYSIDEYSHHHGPFSPRARERYVVFDRVLGRLIDKLRATGQLDSSLLVLGADHGHSEVREHFDLEGFVERLGYKALYYPRKHMRHWLDADAAVMVAGNGVGHIYLKGPRKWAARPSAAEHLADQPRLVEDLLEQPAVDHVIYRPEHGGPVRVRSRRGQASVRLDGDAVEYRVENGDPFGYGELPARMSRAELLERTAASDYPDAPLQAAQLFDSPRCGDFVVSAAPGYDLRARGDRVEYRSCHGSLHREHMAVPFAISHPTTERTPRTVDVFPTILSLLGQRVPPGIDGITLLTEGDELHAAAG